ncbi:MAG: alpha-N-arabinofuranosidase [Christensenellales bacterium]
MEQTAIISLNANDVISVVDERLYGSFIEHMGRAVYTGIYEPGHPSAQMDGFRTDVIDLIRPLRVPIIRYPGGNFVSGYRWEDGVGPKTSRPIRPEPAWLSIETNQVGTNEFMDFLKLVDAKPMLAVNLGTRGAQDAANLLEYCNFPNGTYYSDMRISHGYTAPHNVKLWCLGNEMDGPWQICAKTAEEYGRLACETAKMMKWIDPDIELVVCGSSFREMPTFGEWEKVVLRQTYEHVDYISLHTYYTNNDGDLPAFLASNVCMDAFIKEVAGICKEIKKEKKAVKDICLSFDEWNVWYHFKKDCKEPQKWIPARPIEEELYNFADAILIGSMLTTLINNSNVVKIACLAQLVNTIAPIMTEPQGRAWLQTTYYPFLYTSQFGRGTALKTNVAAPVYNCDAGNGIPYIDCAAVFNEAENELSLFIINKNIECDIPCTLQFTNFTCRRIVEWVALDGYAPDAVNTAYRTTVKPRTKSGGAITANSVRLVLPKLSWNMLRISMC